VTSKAYADPKAIPLRDTDLESGSLNLDSYMRPGKLFTAHQGLVASEPGQLKQEVFQKLVGAFLRILSPAAEPWEGKPSPA
jgi:mRNA interferase MazF